MCRNAKAAPDVTEPCIWCVVLAEEGEGAEWKRRPLFLFTDRTGPQRWSSTMGSVCCLRQIGGPPVTQQIIEEVDAQLLARREGVGRFSGQRRPGTEEEQGKGVLMLRLLFVFGWLKCNPVTVCNAPYSNSSEEGGFFSTSQETARICRFDPVIATAFGCAEA